MRSDSIILSNSAAGNLEQQGGSEYKWALKRTQRAFKLLLIPLLVWLFFLYLYPLLGILIRSFLDPGLTLKHYAHFVNVSAYQSVLFSTTKIALFVTLASCLRVSTRLPYGDYPTSHCQSGAHLGFASFLDVHLGKDLCLDGPPGALWHYQQCVDLSRVDFFASAPDV
jgi:hypothetical protein